MKIINENPNDENYPVTPVYAYHRENDDVYYFSTTDDEALERISDKKTVMDCPIIQANFKLMDRFYDIDDGRLLLVFVENDHPDETLYFMQLDDFMYFFSLVDNIDFYFDIEGCLCGNWTFRIINKNKPNETLVITPYVKS